MTFLLPISVLILCFYRFWCFTFSSICPPLSAHTYQLSLPGCLSRYELFSATALVLLKVKVLQFLWLAMYFVIPPVSLKMLLLRQEDTSCGWESLDSGRSVPCTPRKRAKGGTQQIHHCKFVAPTPQKCSQGASGLLVALQSWAHHLPASFPNRLSQHRCPNAQPNLWVLLNQITWQMWRLRVEPIVCKCAEDLVWTPWAVVCSQRWSEWPWSSSRLPL